MTTTTMPSAAKPATKHCHCECGGTAECCELECLVHPRFFCGQLLADQDLSALVDWIKNKTGLARFRHGWGIVCGLGVHCGPSGSVIVAPGYAMDCCGRDVVLCKEATFDLSQCWKRPPSVCSGQLPSPSPKGKDASQGDIVFGGFTIPRAQVQVFDVLVRYAESQSDARTALARGGCGGAAGCEYTRVHEDFKLYCEPAEDCYDINDQSTTEWYSEYRKELATKLAELERIRSLSDPRAKLQRLLEYVHHFPPSTFCFVCEWLCDLQREQELPGEWDRDIYLWILQDWRNTRFRIPCRSCGPDTGILLARVWVWMRRDSRGNEVFTTLLVNSYPPFRRMLSHDTWPVQAGSVNLAPYIWDRAEAAITPLQQAGFTIERRDLNPADVINVVRREPPLLISVATTNGLTIYQYPDLCNEQRIVCFGWPGKLTNNVKDLRPDDPRLDLKVIPGIGDVISGRLKAKNIRNVIELSQAKPKDVRDALAGINVPSTPGEADLIRLAKEHLDALTKES